MGGNVCPDGGRCEVEGMLINTERQRVSLAPGALGSLQMREKASGSLETKEGSACVSWPGVWALCLLSSVASAVVGVSIQADKPRCPGSASLFFQTLPSGTI